MDGTKLHATGTLKLQGLLLFTHVCPNTLFIPPLRDI